MSPELKVRFRTSLSWAVVSNAVIGLANLVGQIYFARTLGLDVLASYAVLVIALDLIFIAVNFGFNQAVVRGGTSGRLAGAAIALTYVQSAAFFFLSGLIYAAYEFISPNDVADVIEAGFFLVVARIIGNLAVVSYAQHEATMNYGFISRARLASVVASVIVAMVVSLFWDGIEVYVVRDLLASVVLLFLVVQVSGCIILNPSLTKDEVRTVWQFSRKMWLLNALERLALRIDYALVGMAFGRETLGIYFQVRGLVEGLLGFVVAPVQTVFYSFYCRLRELKIRTIQFQSRYLVYVLISLVLSIFCASYIGESVVRATLGNEWTTGGGLLPGLVLYAWGVILFEAIKVVAMAENLHGSMAFARITQIIVLSLSTIPLTTLFGFYGAGISTGIGALMLTLIAWLILVKRMHVD